MKNYNYYTADREAGNIIAGFETLEEAKKALLEYETTDKKEGTYSPNFYCIEDSNKNIIE